MITGIGTRRKQLTEHGAERRLQTPAAAAAGLEESEEQEEQQDGGRHGEDEEQLGAGDPRVGRGLAPRRRDLGAPKEPLGPEPRELLQCKARARSFRSDGRRTCGG